MMLTILQGDCRDVLPTLPPASVQSVITSPPYFGLRQYTDGDPREIGGEPTPAEYVATLVEVFRAMRAVLRDDGTLWLNLGDSYANDAKWGGASSGKHVRALHGATGIGRRRTGTGLPSKSLIGIPWRVALALQDDGWILRSDCIWHKPNAMPESVTDRPTRDHEYVFLLSKQERYYYNADAIREPHTDPDSVRRHKNRGRGKQAWAAASGRDRQPQRDSNNGLGGHPLGRNKRTVWSVPTAPYSDAHFATFPPALIEPCILAGSRPGDVVLDPFFGSGTTGRVALQHGRACIGIELNAAYLPLAEQRTDRVQLALTALGEVPPC